MPELDEHLTTEELDVIIEALDNYIFFFDEDREKLKEKLKRLGGFENGKV